MTRIGCRILTFILTLPGTQWVQDSETPGVVCVFKAFQGKKMDRRSRPHSRRFPPDKTAWNAAANIATTASPDHGGVRRCRDRGVLFFEDAHSIFLPCNAS